MAESNPKIKSLVSPTLDFWLLGGISVVVWFLLLIAQSFKGMPFVQAHFNNIPYAMATLALICNYPHFLASYKLAYTRGQHFVRRSWFQLIVAPSVLLGVLIGAYFVPIISQQVLLGYMVNLMFFTVGWHYTKQVFGCVLVYSRYDNYKISRFQKETLRFSLLSIWWITVIQSNLYGSQSSFYGLNFKQWDFYDWLYPLSVAAVILGLLSVIFGVFISNWRSTGSWPSVNMLIPFIAINVWWLPFARQNEFYMYLTPFFHSLQYLAFVYKIEATSKSEIGSLGQPQPARGSSSIGLTVLVFALVLSGWAAFEIIPNSLDLYLNTKENFTIPYFLIGFNLFINIHHYFIDNAIWRFNDETIRTKILDN